MSWEKILKEDIEKGMLSDVKNKISTYFKQRKVKGAVRQLTENIAGDVKGMLGGKWGNEHQPGIDESTRWGYTRYNQQEWNEYGERFKVLVKAEMAIAIDEVWDDVWQERKRMRETAMNYEPWDES